MTARHVPPSRRRFELSHPTVTTRVDRELHLALVDIAGAKAVTLAEVARDALAAYVESDVVEDDGDELEPHGPESHPEYVALTAEVERLQAERSRLQRDQYQTQLQLRDVLSKQSVVQDNAERAKARLTKMAGPLGMYEYCLRCGYPWHEHVWKGLNKSWLCPRD